MPKKVYVLTRDQVSTLIIRHAREAGITVKPEDIKFIDLDDERYMSCFEARVTIEE